MKVSQSIKNFSRHLLLISLPMLVPCSVIADETEIFFQNDATLANANVLFVLDGSGSMRSEVPGSGGQSRMEVMQDAFREVIINAPEKVNVGLMHYANSVWSSSGYQWKAVKGPDFPISPLNQNAVDVIGSYVDDDNLSVETSINNVELPVSYFLSEVVDSWSPNGFTPIMETLYEAARYYRGETAIWGNFPPAYKWAAHPASYSGTTSCKNTSDVSCIEETGKCNGSQRDCSTQGGTPECCSWIPNPNGNGNICENNDFSCSTGITTCTHTICTETEGNIVYKSPIQNQCQPNYLVLMSDGKPEYPFYSSQPDGTGRYPESVYPDKSHPGGIYNPRPEVDSSVITTAIPAMIGKGCVDKPSGYASGTCGPELTRFLADNDQNSELAGEQTVETYTVAFGLGGDTRGTKYLASLATVDGGAYTANNSDELVEAFEQIFNTIDKRSFSFSSPSFSISDDSLLSHGSSVYVPVLDISRSARWSGNLRKFTLADDGTIVGRDEQNALTETGGLTNNAQGLWSDEIHGANVRSGGAASKIPDPDRRVLWTDMTNNALAAINSDLPAELFSRGSYRTQHKLHDWLEGEQDGYSMLGWYMDCDGNRIKVRPWQSDNPGFVQGPVNIEEVTTCADMISEEEKTTLINFLRGYEDGVTEGGNVRIRKHMGDMLNTKPLVVNYSQGDESSRKLVFAPTNEGFLHAFDAETGAEKWAFMPAALLKNQTIFLENTLEKEHVYGLDGPLTLWRFKKDTDNDGVGDLEQKWLFFGMRRGGNAYYALNITNPDAPKVEWKISPDGEGGAITQGFASLGETWSKPTLSRIRDPRSPTKPKYVLVFGGGYDPSKDELDAGARGGRAELGSDVYIVDALDGSHVWSLKGDSVSGSSDLVHSVPGDIRVLDMDNDGTLDRMYFADTGGYIWRVDFVIKINDNNGTVTQSVNSILTKFADLGSEGVTDGDRRKFFYEPDTALRLENGKPILTVSLGSGYRTHPLDTGDHDRFYVLLDDNVYSLPDDGFTTITESSLVSAGDLRASGKSILQFRQDQQKSGGREARGWYYPLAHHGEKVLASSLTFLDKVIFTTFALADENGEDSDAALCIPAENTSRVYVLDMLTGKPVANLDRTEVEDDQGNVISTPDDFLVAGYNEILDAPQIIFDKLTSASGGECTKGDCQQSVSIRVGRLDMSVLDTKNANNNGSFSESVDLTKVLPRLYWRDEDVSANDELEGSEPD